MCKFTAFYVKVYIPFLKDVCEFVLPFGVSLLLTVLHAKEKCTCGQLASGCVHMLVCLIIDVEY